MNVVSVLTEPSYSLLLNSLVLHYWTPLQHGVPGICWMRRSIPIITRRK
jgi:hypothetical protein